VFTVPGGGFAAHRPGDHIRCGQRGGVGVPGAYACGPMPGGSAAGYDRRMSSPLSPAPGQASPSRTVLVWAGAVAFPLLLVLLLAIDPGSLEPALRFVLVVVVMLLPVAAVRRGALRMLGIMLLTVAAVTALFPHGEAFWFVSDIVVLQIVMINLALGYIAATRPRQVSASAAALALGVELLVSAGFLVWPVQDSGIVLVLAAITVWVVGNSVRQRRGYRAARAEQEALRVIQAERLRIARELHDMVAHSIGVIAIQAGVGSRVIETQPAEARNALSAIEDTSRETLAGLRRMLVALRGAEPDGSAPLDPTPGLDDLEELVERTAKAGVRVEVRWAGERQPLPPDIDLSAYRIIQEAVTNVARHAAVDRCDVAVDLRGGLLTLEVTDDGRGAVGAPGPGYGIPGMRERVSLLHGEFDAGPRADGGFRVTARIPVPEGVR
jgi:signal transduction histidine kinase